MHLAQQTRDFTTWTRQVMGVFLGVRRWTTLGVIAAEAISDLTKLIAFFLPLKIILLAGSDGVPRYFPFIDPAQKMPWIAGLAAGAFIAYGLSLLLDSLAERLAEGASSDVLEGANEMALSSNQHEQAQNAYTRFCGIHANVLVIIVGGAAIAVIKPAVAAFLAAALVIQYTLTAGILAGDDDIRPGPVKAWVSGRLNAYLEINSSITFLLGFVVLLLPYLYGAGGNILLAILSIIILRQLLGAVTGIAKSAVQLTRQRDRINAQVFHDQPQRKPENKHLHTLRDLFHKQARQERANAILADVLGSNPQAAVTWADSPRPFLTTLTIGPVGEGDAAHYLQQQIYPAQQRIHLDNEAFLFRHIERARLHAPTCLHRFQEAPFECQIVAYGRGQALDQDAWQGLRSELVTDILACLPPKRMVAAYRKSNRLLDQRMDQRLLDHLALAVDTDAEDKALQALHNGLARLQERLGVLPLCIDNPDLGAATATQDTTGKPLVMLWGRWALEPLGGTRMTRQHKLDTHELLPQIAAQRSDMRDNVYTEDMQLATLCRQIEDHDQKGHYKAALGLVPGILDNLDTERTACAA